MTNIRPYIIRAISIGLLLFATSCNKGGPPVESPAADSASAAGDITQADQLYGQRADLIQVRRGIVALRQALTKDPGNYDAAFWIGLAMSLVSAVAIFIAGPRKVRLVAGRVGK